MRNGEIELQARVRHLVPSLDIITGAYVATRNWSKGMGQKMQENSRRHLALKSFATCRVSHNELLRLEVGLVG